MCHRWIVFIARLRVLGVDQGRMNEPRMDDFSTATGRLYLAVGGAIRS